MGGTRKIAAILVADMVGYSRLAGTDEDRTLSRLRGLRSDLIDPAIDAHHGRIVKRTGDGSLIEFRSVVDAVRCAIELQTGLIERNAGLPPERRIEFRVGIHLGDVVEETDGDLTGDGVNIAARLEGIAARRAAARRARLTTGIVRSFVVVGWTDPEGSRPHLGALLLGYYDDGKLIYAGRGGTGMPDKGLADLRRRLEPLARADSPLSAPPPRKTRFGSPLVLSRAHWVEPQLVVEITYLTWTDDGLLRQTVYVGLRSDKPATQVRREVQRKGQRTISLARRRRGTRLHRANSGHSPGAAPSALRQDRATRLVNVPQN
jgi:hypothetical protein